ncbi:hypothetical protein G9A89_010896 [Geosiphon pyriformis]|nr:hypothetical protein G9A89_010896 [Geosiphon pyriformis]
MSIRIARTTKPLFEILLRQNAQLNHKFFVTPLRPSERFSSTWFTHVHKRHSHVEAVSSVANISPLVEPQLSQNPPLTPVEAFQSLESSPNISDNPSPNDENKVLYELNKELIKSAHWLNVGRAYNTCTIMSDKGIKPNLETYKALLALYQPLSLFEECLELVHEMIGVGIEPDLDICHSLLKASVHSATSCYREYAMSLLEKYNLTPTPKTYEFYIDGLVAQEEAEHAIDFMNEMIKKSDIPSMVSFEKLIKLIADQAECDEALEWLKKAETHHRIVYPMLYIHLLRDFAFFHFPEGIDYCWKKAVDELKLNLDQGICTDIINSGARLGKPEIAIAAIKHLLAQKAKLEEYHWAGLLEAYVTGGDLKRAFNVLELVNIQGVKKTIKTAWPLCLAIREDAAKVDEAYFILEELHKNGKKIDVTALNVVIFSCGFVGVNPETGSREPDIVRAVETYNQAEKLGVEPNEETFETLLDICVAIKHHSVAHQLVEELRRRGLEPTKKIYNYLIELACSNVDYEEAFAYLEEMKSRNIVPDKVVYEMIIRKCAYMRDPRAKIALEEMETLGFDIPQNLRQYVKKGGKGSKHQLLEMLDNSFDSRRNVGTPGLELDPETERLRAGIQSLEID